MQKPKKKPLGLRVNVLKRSAEKYKITLKVTYCVDMGTSRWIIWNGLS